MTLTVGTPVIANEGGAPGSVVDPEKPIQLTCDPVTFPDGSPLVLEQALLLDYVVDRELVPGAYDSWNEQAKAWVPAAQAPAPQKLFFKDGRWQALMVATGQKDAAGQPKLATDRNTHMPRYSARCVFRGIAPDGTQHDGISPRSQPVEIPAVPSEDDKRGSIQFDPEPATEAESMKMFLKDASLNERGRVEIRAQGGGFVVDLAVDGTLVSLTGGGGITLVPAGGQRVEIQGELAVRDKLVVKGAQVAP